MAIEKTLVIFKPDAVGRGIVGEITTRFERAGLKIVATKMLDPDYDQYYHHYENIGKMISRRGKPAFDTTLTMMKMSPVIAFILEGVDAVSLVRKMVGATDPKNALPGTIRGDYAHMGFAHADEQEIGIPNLLHASGDADEAKLEIAHWFSETEIHSYSISHEKFTQPNEKKN